MLYAWSDSRNAFLIIDAVDAARSDVSLQTICDLITAVQRDAPRWTIVASVREYDLNHSRELQHLFRGLPHPQHGLTTLDRVRHIHVPRLTDDELGQLEGCNAEIWTAIASAGPDLRDLLLNPFNLKLLCDLLSSGVTREALGSIRTQVELLESYWEERVSKGQDRQIRERVMISVVESMVAGRSLRGSTSQFDNHGELSRVLEDLLSAGVVAAADECSIPGPRDTIIFTHNVLYDYAVARQFLRDLPDDLISDLATDDADLLLVIRPSIVFAFQRLWYPRRNIGSA